MKKISAQLWLILFLLSYTSICHAGFFAVGGGAGGDAGEPNVTIEAGDIDVDLADFNCIVSVGIPFILHNDKLPATTINSPSPHNEYTRLGIKRENVEFGMFGRLGMELFDWETYFSLIGGFTRVTEVELVQSNVNPDYYYEQSSNNKTNGLYGCGIGYFPTTFDWQFCVQVDWDTRRGVTGVVGWFW